MGTELEYKVFLQDSFLNMAEKLGFERIDTPFYEQRNLFARSVGEETDIVQKELFYLEKKGDEIYSLRPELTAGIVRSVIENGIKSKPLPYKVYNFGQVFRYEKPQAGRFREINQLDLEIFSLKNELVDAFIIAASYKFLVKMTGEKLIVSLGFMGSDETKKRYSQLLKTYLLENERLFCDTCKYRIKTNALRVLDCKSPECQDALKSAPRISDILNDEEKTYFSNVQDLLKVAGVNYGLDDKLVRGLDYYTSTVFEINIESDKSRQSTLAGGGRYDSLVSELGGPDVGACGVGFGVERIIEFMKKTALMAKSKKAFFVFNKKAADIVIKTLFENENPDLVIDLDFKDLGVSKGLSYANANNYDYVFLLGDEEIYEDNISIKKMSDGTQEKIKLSDIKRYILDL